MLASDTLPELLTLKESDGANDHPDSPKLLDRVRTVMRRQHYILRTEETYVQWIIRFVQSVSFFVLILQILRFYPLTLHFSVGGSLALGQ